MFENCSALLRTHKTASEYPRKPKNTPQRQRMPQILEKPFRIHEKSLESLRTCQNGRERHSKTFHNRSKLIKLSQNTPQHPLNMRERLCTFRNNSIFLNIYENTQVHDSQNTLRTSNIASESPVFFQNRRECSNYPQNVRECYRTFMNLSESCRIYGTTSEHLRTTQEHQRPSQNFQKPFISHQNASECFRKPLTSENAWEPSVIFQNYSESM